MKIPKVSIRQLTSGVYEVRYSYYAQNRRHREKTLLAALQRKTVIEAEIALDRDPEQAFKGQADRVVVSNLTLRELWEVFTTNHLPRISENGARVYRERWKVIEKHAIADREIRLIGPRDVQDYQRERLAGVKPPKPATVNREIQLVKSMLGRAYEWEILQTDPRGRLKLLREDNRRDVGNITAADILRLIEQVPESIGNIIEFAVYTGFRKANILSLTIEQLSLSDIGPSFARLTVKGGTTRVFQLNAQAVTVLKRAIGERTAGAVFLSRDNGPYLDVRRTLDRYVERIGLRIASGQALCFHDLRRVYATWRAASGVDPFRLMNEMGHRQVDTTTRYTSRVASGETITMPEIRRVK